MAGRAEQQLTNASCVAACGAMLSDGTLSQKTLLTRIGENASSEQLARALGPGWAGGGLDVDDPATMIPTLNSIGPWGGRVRAAGGGWHMVIVDGTTEPGTC